MQKLFIPLTFDQNTFVNQKYGGFFVPGHNPWKSFYSLEDAVEHAKQLALTNPSAKVVIFESHSLLEPHKIEFSEKFYNKNGELIV